MALQHLFNQHPTIYKYDRFVTGFIPGLFCPLIGIVLFYFVFDQNTGITWDTYLGYLKMPLLLAPILSFGTIMNLFLFFLIIWRDYYNAARGTIAATFLYAIPIIVIKFFL